MVQRTTQHADTPLIDVPHSRRRVNPLTFDWAALVDTDEKVKLLIDPESVYAQNGAKAAGRRWDRSIISAVSGDAFAVDASDAASTIVLPAAQKIVDGGTGLTMTKVRQAKFLFDDVDVDEEDRVFVASPKGIQQLLTDSTVTSSDYSTLKALEAGTLADKTWMGFQWVMSSLLSKTGNVRKNLAWQKQGIGLAINQDMLTRITERADKSYATQVFLSQVFGATRIEEVAVVTIDIDETV